MFFPRLMKMLGVAYKKNVFDFSHTHKFGIKHFPINVRNNLEQKYIEFYSKTSLNQHLFIFYNYVFLLYIIYTNILFIFFFNKTINL